MNTANFRLSRRLELYFGYLAPQYFFSASEICRAGDLPNYTLRRRIMQGKFPPPDLHKHALRAWRQDTIRAHDAELAARILEYRGR